MKNKLKVVVILIISSLLFAIAIFLIVFLFKDEVDTEKLGLIIATILGASGIPAILTTILSKKSLDTSETKITQEPEKDI